jgi:TetR/AcrR family transcriptional repressor of nem operon
MNGRTRKASRVVNLDFAARIEEVATRLFILHGYNGVSYLDVARELAVTHSSIHYYFRTKALLAEAVLRRVADTTLGAMKGIWADPESSLRAKFVGTRDWMHAQFLQSNPTGKGGRPWGLLSRFSLEADALSTPMRRILRASLDRLEEHVNAGVRAAVGNGELAADAPVAPIALQIVSLMAVTGPMTRHASGFDRVDELMHWSYVVIARAYGRTGSEALEWPAVPDPKREPDPAASTAGTVAAR